MRLICLEFLRFLALILLYLFYSRNAGETNASGLAGRRALGRGSRDLGTFRWLRGHPCPENKLEPRWPVPRRHQQQRRGENPHTRIPLVLGYRIEDFEMYIYIEMSDLGRVSNRRRFSLRPLGIPVFFHADTEINVLTYCTYIEYRFFFEIVSI